jgi:hypothetical protein
MSSTPVLVLSDFGQQFIVEIDAYDTWLGVVLMQGKMPIAFLSKPLSAANKLLPIYEEELLALIMAVERWVISYLCCLSFVTFDWMFPGQDLEIILSAQQN